MKRSELVRQLLEQGCVLLRHGARHDMYINPATGQKQPVPRHTEVDDALAKHIKKYLGLKPYPVFFSPTSLSERDRPP